MSKLEFTLDEEGKEILLKDGTYQVMMAWEKPYMEACIDAIKPSGDVLEVGFGLGFASTRIQHFRPKSHTIIECDPVVAERARKWAKDYTGVTIVEKTWQEALPLLGKYDTVFFDDYPLEEVGKIEKAVKEADQAAPIVKKGKQLMKTLLQKLPSIKSIKYKDRDLEKFAASMKEKDKPRLIPFLLELFHNQQITREQLKKYVSEEEIKKSEKGKGIVVPGRSDRLFSFLLPCLKDHMRIGARFSCYLEEATSKTQDPVFEKEVITNPYLDYTEHWIHVDVPKNCRYFTGREALVITITKQS